MESCARRAPAPFSLGRCARRPGPRKAAPRRRILGYGAVDLFRRRLPPARSTKRRQERSCRVVSWTAGINPHSRRVPSDSRCPLSDDAAYKSALRPSGRRSPGQPRPGLPLLLGRKCVTGLTQARATTRTPAPGHLRPSSSDGRELPPVATLFLASGRDHDCFTLIRPGVLARSPGGARLYCFHRQQAPAIRPHAKHHASCRGLGFQAPGAPPWQFSGLLLGH